MSHGFHASITVSAVDLDPDIGWPTYELSVEPDFDGDGEVDGVDTDDDNDGLSDAEEVEVGSDPLNPDTDGDLFLDGLDACPVSDLSVTVWVADSDSGAANLIDGELVDDMGCSLADLINIIARDRAETKVTHGGFVSAVSSELNRLHNARLITGEQKGLLMMSVA